MVHLAAGPALDNRLITLLLGSKAVRNCENSQLCGNLYCLLFESDMWLAQWLTQLVGPDDSGSMTWEWLFYHFTVFWLNETTDRIVTLRSLC